MSRVLLRVMSLERSWDGARLLWLLALLMGRPVMSVSSPYLLKYHHLHNANLVLVPERWSCLQHISQSIVLRQRGVCH